MNDIAIRVENLSKQYRIGRRESYQTLRDSFTEACTAPFRRLRSLFRGSAGPGESNSQELFWALQDVSFEVKRGEVVGIIGRNGAGKSTLLKILSRITEPTKGYIEIKGRIASLLEVGTGFHQELTGRENIYLNGAILGMRKAEIDRKFDEIVAFSEVEKFIDTPVKFYSSGMYVRLAFAVAAHLEPDILLVDEVLAVGDVTFQKKCLGKMGEVAQEGRTVLFISHNMGVIKNICEKCLLLEEGYLKLIGNSDRIIEAYLRDTTISSSFKIDLSNMKRKIGQGRILKIKSIEWINGFPLNHEESAITRIYFEAFSRLEEVSFGIGFSTLDGQRLLTYTTDYLSEKQIIIDPGQDDNSYIEMKIEKLPLVPGVYSLDIGARVKDIGIDYLKGFTQLIVLPGNKTSSDLLQVEPGVRMPIKWQIKNDFK